MFSKNVGSDLEMVPLEMAQTSEYCFMHNHPNPIVSNFILGTSEEITPVH